MRKIALTLTLIAIGQAHAACGGGGWKKPQLVNTTSTAHTSTPVVQSVATRLEKSTPQPLETAVTATLGNATEINIASLKLTEKQTEQAEKIQRDVQREYTQLKEELVRAQAQIEKCHGDCGPELAHKRDLEKQLAAFEPVHETKERIYVALGICDIPTAKSTAVAR